MAASNSGPTQVTFLAPEKQDEDVTPKKLGKLTVQYNRKELQRRIKLEEWLDARIQELYQSQEFTMELLERLKGLRKLADLQHK